MTKTYTHRQKGLTKSDWVKTARKILIKDGAQGISLRKLSISLSVTTGAFYWLYQNLEDLHDELREDWIRHNTSVFTKIFENNELSGGQKWLAYAREIIIDNNFDPKYDNAMREWATTSKKTAKVVERIDLLRVDQLTHMFTTNGI